MPLLHSPAGAWLFQQPPKGIPLLHQVDAQHRGQRVRRATDFAGGLGEVGLNQVDQCLPWHHRVHLPKELPPLGTLLGGGLLVVAKSQLLAALHQSPGL